MDLLEATLDALRQNLFLSQESERVVDHVMRAHPDWDQPTRASFSRRVLGISCLRARLGYLVRSAGLVADLPELLLAYLLDVEKHPASEAAFLSGSPQSWAEVLASHPPHWPSDPVERLSAQGSLPSWLAQLWIDELGPAHAEALTQASNQPGPVVLRANILRTHREALSKVLAEEGIVTEPGRLAPEALIVQGRANLFGSRAWREGLFEVQDEGSQLIASACEAKPGERWLDLCAGSGGKTLALAAALQGRGQLVATDVDANKLDNLRARLQRNGVENVEVIQLEPGDEARALGSRQFDGVLVDAPCSELGTLRRHPDLRWRIQPSSMDSLPGLQRSLIELGRTQLAPGGRLIYATCTLRRAENEEVASAIGLRAVRTLLPHRDGTDGFFIASS